MYDHLGIKVKDLATSVRFYTAALAPLGHVLCSSDATSAGFGPQGAAALWIGPAKQVTTTLHVAFRAANRKAVDAFYRRGIEAGGRDNGGPGLRPDYSPTYYAAFLIDPDGNNVEAVCTE